MLVRPRVWFFARRIESIFDHTKQRVGEGNEKVIGTENPRATKLEILCRYLQRLQSSESVRQAVKFNAQEPIPHHHRGQPNRYGRGPKR
jgi:hypothetical protein